MRRILTVEEKEKKNTRNKVIIGLVLVAIMILSTLGYSFFSGTNENTNSKKITYNGINFIYESGVWIFNTQNTQFLTSFNPKETENISVPVYKKANDFYQKPVFFIGKGPGSQEIARTLSNFALRMQDGCLKNYENCEENAPIKNCSEDYVIVVEESEDIEIKQDENCIFILSPYDEQTRAADAFIFKILGVS